jgi:hypothetical protein
MDNINIFLDYTRIQCSAAYGSRYTYVCMCIMSRVFQFVCVCVYVCLFPHLRRHKNAVIQRQNEGT